LLSQASKVSDKVYGSTTVENSSTNTSNQQQKQEEIPDEQPTVLTTMTVPIILEVLLPLEIQGNPLTRQNVIQNVEAMQWSLLNKLVHQTGLNDDCSVEKQFKNRSLHAGRKRELRPLQYPTEEKPVLPLAHQGQQRHMMSLPYPTSVYMIASDLETTKWKGTTY
jgi:hypothetical protein